jgi:protein TonB
MVMLLFTLPIIAWGQVDSLVRQTEIVSALESWPSYNDGAEEMQKIISESLMYPQSAIDDSVSGIVYVQMIVDTLGCTKSHTIVKGVRQDLNKEALRIAKLIHFDKPATQNGKPVSVMYSIPIMFQLPK